MKSAANKHSRAIRLPLSFYRNPDVLEVSRALIGKVIVSSIGDQICSGIIVETEAYRAPEDKASHAYDNRCTDRTRVMFYRGGHAYIYLCYGIHHLFNIVTGPRGEAHAVLLRAIEPLEGLQTMRKRRTIEGSDRQLTNGPGKLSEALHLKTKYTGIDMLSAEAPFWIEDRSLAPDPSDVQATKRIGVEYSEECADWPWRFIWNGNPWVSK